MSKIKYINENEIKSYKDLGYIVYTDESGENFIREEFTPISPKIKKTEKEEIREDTIKKIEEKLDKKVVREDSNE